METATEQQILLTDLLFVTNKLILNTDEEILGPFNSRVVGKKVSGQGGCAYSMVVDIANSIGVQVDMKIRCHGAAIAHVCYQMVHVPTEKFSPIYSHAFEKEQVMIAGIPQLIGKMKLYDAKDVWPELCELGYYGELPQFYL